MSRPRKCVGTFDNTPPKKPLNNESSQTNSLSSMITESLREGVLRGVYNPVIPMLPSTPLGSLRLPKTLPPEPPSLKDPII